MIQEITLTVRRIVHARDDGAAIFSGITADGAAVRVVAGRTALSHVPGRGDTLRVTGSPVQHPKYGRQLLARRCVPVIPRGRLIVRHLSECRAFEGLGPVKAKQLWQHFGDALLTVLDAGDEARLSEVLSPNLAASVSKAWQSNRRIGELVNRLDTLGFEVRLANKIIRVWGERAEEMLDRNPYHMLAFAGWQTVERAAAKLGITHDDDRRRIGAVEAIVYERLLDAHTVTDDAQLKRSLATRVGAGFVDKAIALASSEGAITGAPDTGWQAIGAATLERRIERRLGGALLAGRQTTLFPAPFASEEWLESKIADAEASLGFRLNAEQRAAVRMAVTSPVSLLLGGAGVGKTVVLGVIIGVAESMHLGTVQVALAGRAAKRMAEATGRPAMTIARLLMTLKNGQLEVPSSMLLIVDEASMLDLPTTYRLLQQLPDGVRILLVGDPAQLPPIGFGLVFHRLVDVPRIPRTVLIQVHRQDDATGIPAVASAIRQHTVPSLPRFDGTRTAVSLVECEPDEIQDMLRSITECWAGEDWRIICATKSGAGGFDATNRCMHTRNPNADEDDEYAVGDPVIHLSNDYDRGLMNGSLGRVVEIHESGVLVVDFEAERYAFEPDEVAERLALAYAVSCHKAQGSQFDRVAVVVAPSRILDHSLIYTAVTRAVKQVVLVGSKTAFRQAVSNPPHAHRRQVLFFASELNAGAK
jgi:exodeoxyribonuclease V alpha subunit